MHSSHDEWKCKVLQIKKVKKLKKKIVGTVLTVELISLQSCCSYFFQFAAEETENAGSSMNYVRSI